MRNAKTSSAVDWSALHDRLARARAALENASELSPELQIATLKARSQRLAADPGGGEREASSFLALEFWLAPESYAIACEFVREVAALREYSSLPNAAPFVVGVTSLRGRMISILDLRRFFGLPAPGITDLNRIIVLTHRDLELGLLADQVLGVSKLYQDRLSGPLPAASARRASFCRGIGKDGLVVLDVPRLLSSDGLVPTAGAHGARFAEDGR